MWHISIRAVYTQWPQTLTYDSFLYFSVDMFTAVALVLAAILTNKLLIKKQNHTEQSCVHSQQPVVWLTVQEHRETCSFKHSNEKRVCFRWIKSVCHDVACVDSCLSQSFSQTAKWWLTEVQHYSQLTVQRDAPHTVVYLYLFLLIINI